MVFPSSSCSSACALCNLLQCMCRGTRHPQSQPIFCHAPLSSLAECLAQPTFCTAQRTIARPPALQHTPFSTRPSAHALQHTPFSTRPSAHALQHTPFSTRPSAHALQHTPFSTRPSAHALQHTPFSNVCGPCGCAHVYGQTHGSSGARTEQRSRICIRRPFVRAPFNNSAPLGGWGGVAGTTPPTPPLEPPLQHSPVPFVSDECITMTTSFRCGTPPRAYHRHCTAHGMACPGVWFHTLYRIVVVALRQTVVLHR